ncbi:MAG: DUF58 domain-containing protein [Actinomycetota bacterium]|nr:DUF58 domain-containing protein [Actinomycetota bacterium]
MPSGRGLVVLGAGIGMWFAARLIGSPGLEVVGFGLATLPFLAAAYIWRRKPRIAVRRHLSDVRVAPGTRVTITLDVENRSVVPTSLLLIEDRLPSALGRPARLVVPGVRSRGTENPSYSVLAQVRGRYRLGPLSVDVCDPFALVRSRIEFDIGDDLLVIPEIEELLGAPNPAFGPSFGASRTRQLFRTGDEYYTMRQYQEGDDLRRIHWASVARTGELMIRQDESSRRASGLVLLDTRSSALGRMHGEAFERAVSIGATLGMLLAKRGFSLRVATADLSPALMTEERFLDTLASASHSNTKSIEPVLGHLRAGASSETTLVFVSAPPLPSEIGPLLRSGAGFGSKLAILVYPMDPSALPADRQAQVEGRATQARLALTRAGWDCIVMPPSTKLKERWREPRERLLVHSG